MDSLYTASTLAIRPKTGEMVWYYQSVPNDSFDFDANAESLIADIQVQGQMRKVLISAHKNGFFICAGPHQWQADRGKPFR
jgi:alcohol dehydrogenase (cytochrome c)